MTFHCCEIYDGLSIFCLLSSYIHNLKDCIFYFLCAAKTLKAKNKVTPAETQPPTKKRKREKPIRRRGLAAAIFVKARPFLFVCI